VAVSGETRFGLLRVGGGRRAAPDADPDPAEAWWRTVSGGRWQPRAVALPPVMLADDPAGWCVHGGMAPGPRNAATLARAALMALPPMEDCPEAIVMVLPAPVAPHAWRVADGGVAVGPGRWVRRYAALPADAHLGAWVHEMAHLLLGWPDLPGSPCLMGHGAARKGGRDPAMPNPATALEVGWLRLSPLVAELPAWMLAPGDAMALDWGRRRILITREDEVFAIHDRDNPGPPLASGRLASLTGPLLAGVVSALVALGE
jgi:hypothetical protein